MKAERPAAPDVALPRVDERRILNGQTALVTGGNSGIGRGIALALAKAGADVVVDHVDGDEGARETVEAVERAGRRAVALRADVAREDEVRKLFERACAVFGTVDILVNNAGVQDDAPLEEMTLEQWNRVIGVNLTGQFLCAREAVREFKRRGVRPEISCAAGKIICISSVHERIPWAGHANYAASKGGVDLLMRSIAQEVAPHRIRVNSISPGAVRTSINRSAWETPEAYGNLLNLIPYRRIGEVDDIGRVAAWLASDEADYITGASLYVDGGMTLYPGFAAGA